ncbi:MAG: alpha/beta hydrolase [Acidimicrobiales bacterium]
MNVATKEGLLEVPGAKLFYKTCGTGPVLLTLQGGGGDADGSDGLAEALGDRYTVVAYDRRGLSRSSIDDSSAPAEVRTHSDDASRLLAALSDEPAYVFGSSMGALIGLDLVAAHPEQVRLLVAHEAPAAQLLDEPECTQLKEQQRDVEATFEREGLFPAMQKFLAIAGGFADDPEAEVKVQRPTGERMAQHGTNLQFFLAHDAPSVHRFQLDLAVLQSVAERIVPAAGLVSRGSMPHHCAEALARVLGRKLEEFPGGHSGHVSRPRAFAEVLHQVLTAGA